MRLLFRSVLLQRFFNLAVDKGGLPPTLQLCQAIRLVAAAAAAAAVVAAATGPMVAAASA